MELEYVTRDDGSVAVQCSDDPCISRVLGWRRHWVGLDLGAVDASAYCVLLDEQLPTWDTGSKQILGPRRLEVVGGDFLQAESYHQLQVIVWNLMKQPQLIRPTLICDIGSAGRAFADGYEAHPDYAKRPHLIRLQITGGEAETNVGTHWRAARNKILGDAHTHITNGDVELADWPMRDQLVKELALFTQKEGPSGQRKIEGARIAGSHLDLAMAASYTIWAAHNHVLCGDYGPKPLRWN